MGYHCRDVFLQERRPAEIPSDRVAHERDELHRKRPVVAELVANLRNLFFWDHAETLALEDHRSDKPMFGSSSRIMMW